MIGAMYRIRISTMKLAYNRNKTENEAKTNCSSFNLASDSLAFYKKKEGKHQ